MAQAKDTVDLPSFKLKDDGHKSLHDWKELKKIIGTTICNFVVTKD